MRDRFARLFQARYYGRCTLCQEGIEPGDWVGYVDSDLCCELCVEESNDG